MTLGRTVSHCTHVSVTLGRTQSHTVHTCISDTGQDTVSHCTHVSVTLGRTQSHSACFSCLTLVTVTVLAFCFKTKYSYVVEQSLSLCPHLHDSPKQPLTKYSYVVQQSPSLCPHQHDSSKRPSRGVAIDERFI